MIKDQILKIAKVKSEADFYRKFPTEAAFMKVHGKALKKAAMGASMVNRNLHQLTDFDNLPKAQNGLVGEEGPGVAKSAGKMNPYLQAGMDVVEGVSMIKDQNKAVKEAEQNSLLTGVQSDALAGQRRQPLKNYYTRPEDTIIQPDQLSPSYGVGTNILSAKNGTMVGGNPTEIQNTYAPNTLYDDLGYEPLNDSDQIKAFYHGGRIPMAQNGFSSSLNESGFGNFMNEQGGSEALGNLSNMLVNKGRGPSAGSKIGGGVGAAAGSFFGGPVGAAVGKFAGQAIGGLIDQSGKNIEKYDDISNANIAGMMGNYIPQQFSNVMEDGGWVSNDWQPQVIAKFGEYDVKDLLKPPADADMLRAGGHIRGGYTPPSERAMQTYAMGGELKTHWGGYAEPISYNPYLPGTGETVMFRGQSHDESDKKGNAGIGITYGNNPVEVERGEPMFELQEGGEIDPLTGEPKKSGIVLGNLKINKEGADMLGNPKLKNQKFKNYGNDLSKIEAKQNKIIDKSINTLDNLDVQSSFDKLKMSALQANLMGSNMKLKDIAGKKQDAANLQSAINDTSEEYGLIADDLAQGKIKEAKMGTSIKAQGGKTVSMKDRDYLQGLYRSGDIKKFQEETVKLYPDLAKEVVNKFPETNYAKKSKFVKGDIRGLVDSLGGPRTEALNKLLEIPNVQKTDKGNVSTKPVLPLPKSTATSATHKALYAPDEPVEKFDWLKQGMNAVNQALPYLRPSDAENLDPRQLMGEMYALSNNQVEPVQAQTFQPQLQTPYDISLQDQINEITAQTRQAERLAGNNPEALAAIYGQATMAKNQVLGEQMRLNQAQKADVYGSNINTLNQAQLQNLQIYDTQQQRQEAAKSATKATTQEALNSVASKYAQNKLENRQLGVMENMYNYRFDKSGRAINMNPLVDFDEMIASATPDELSKYKALLEAKTSKEKTSNKAARNGSIVKAIKNL
jgi:hypothetical protein